MPTDFEGGGIRIPNNNGFHHKPSEFLQNSKDNNEKKKEEESALIQQIIRRYETEEDDFLRELAAMREEATPATLGIFQSEAEAEEATKGQSPVLGTLCHLVGEIGELRRQNRRLQRRLVSVASSVASSGSGSKKAAATASSLIIPKNNSNNTNNKKSASNNSVVHRVNAFLDRSTRLNTLTRLIGSSVHLSSTSLMISSGSSSGIFNNNNVVRSPHHHHQHQQSAAASTTTTLMTTTTTEVKQGARERLSSPVGLTDALALLPPIASPNNNPKDHSLINSAYSADLSSSDFSSCRMISASRMQQHQQTAAPPLVLPETEISDSELEMNDFRTSTTTATTTTIPTHYPRQRIVPMNTTATAHLENGLRGVTTDRSRRSMTRRRSAHFSSISEHTSSPSSVSATSSSTEPNDHHSHQHLASSRGSFLELLGIRARKKWNSARLRGSVDQTDTPATNNAKMQLKKRKRKISESVEQAAKPHAAVSNSDRQRYSLCDISYLESINAGDSLCLIRRNNNNNNEKKEEEEEKKWRNVDKVLEEQTKWSSSDRPLKIGSSREQTPAFQVPPEKPARKHRPKSMVYLEPFSLGKKENLRVKTKSCKSVNNVVNSAESCCQNCCGELLERFRAENAMLRGEFQVLKTRNNRLIDQLREKSMHLSLLQSHKTQLEEQMDSQRREEQFNALVERLCLRTRFAKIFDSAFGALEEKLRVYETEIQAIRGDALRNQQMTINATLCDQNSYQSCLEQVERLQRENFSLLQMRVSEMNEEELGWLRQRLDLLPSYDALYSFSIGIVRKLRQMRNLLTEKANQSKQAEMEIMNLQSTLLLTHAQVERLRVARRIQSSEHVEFVQRRHSYHGVNFLDKIMKPELNFLLPFQLHGARLQQQHKYHASSMSLEERVDANENNIEIEFLKLFDYARCLSRIREERTTTPHRKLTGDGSGATVEPVIVYRNGRGTVSPMNSPQINESRKSIVTHRHPHPVASVSPRNSPIVAQRKSNGKSTNATRRPFSWLEPAAVGGAGCAMTRRPSASHLRKCVDEEPEFSSTRNSTPNSSPLLDIQKLGNFFRIKNHPNRNSPRLNRLPPSGAASLHDLCGVARSPSTTPILTRRVPLIGGGGSPSQICERRLIKQTSLQTKFHHYPRDVPLQYNHPLYDSPPLAKSRRNKLSHNNLHEPQSIVEASSSCCSSADYNTISSNQPTGIHQSGSIFSRGGCSSLERAVNNNNNSTMAAAERQLPAPSAPPISLIGSTRYSRLPQLNAGSVAGVTSSPKRGIQFAQKHAPFASVSKPTSPCLSSSPRAPNNTGGYSTTTQQKPQTPQPFCTSQQRNNQRYYPQQMPSSPQQHLPHFGAHRFPNSPPPNVAPRYQANIAQTNGLILPQGVLLEAPLGIQQAVAAANEKISRLPKPAASPVKKSVNSWLSRLKINHNNKSS